MASESSGDKQISDAVAEANEQTRSRSRQGSDAEFARGSRTHHYTHGGPGGDTGGPIQEFFTQIPYAVTWIGVAAASGVIGNLTYEVIQKLINRVRQHPMKFTAEELLPMSVARPKDVDRLARQTVRARCGELGWPVPPLAALVVAEIRYRDKERVWNVVITGPNLEAEVVVAEGEGYGQDIPIMIRKFTSEPDDENS